MSIRNDLPDDRIEEALRGLPRVEPPVDLRRNIYAAIERKKSAKRWFWIGLPIPAAAAAGFLLAVLFQARSPANPPRVQAQVEPTVVAPRDGEVLLPEDVEIMTYGAKAEVQLDGVPVAGKEHEPGAFIYIPNDLEPGYHKVVIEVDGKKVEASFYVEE